MIQYLAQAVPLDEIKPGILPFTAANAGVGAENLISTIVGFLTIISGLAFIVYLIIAGFNWITAGPDMEKVKKAQSNITNAITGLLIVIIAYAVTAALGALFGSSIPQPATILNRLGPSPTTPTIIIPPLDFPEGPPGEFPEGFTGPG